VSERWLDRQALADHLGCSVRNVELRMAEGMPAWKVMGRVKFKVSEAEPWLEENGYITRLDSPCDNVAGSTKRPGDRSNGPGA
jgi:hypothetical protein